ncbi:helix-hairpin-helix domain-containing protein [bacterium]|nr:helix-hairpin-helix domain-containing protein [bacterium]
MDTRQKLQALADSARFDLSCACGTKDNDDHRRRGPDGLWLYPVALPSGGQSVMLKTLLSNACVNDCRYCPFRCDQDTRRYTLRPEEVASVFMDFVRRKQVMGLFLSSGVVRDADHTMEHLNAVARLLRRRYEYRGFIHLKVLPGASDAAIEEAVNLAGAVSLNVEVPTRAAFRNLATTKDFDRDIVRPIKLISRLTARGMRRSRVKHSTQFIVGASTETDADIVKATAALYRQWGLHRAYFSAYQRGLGDPTLPGERDTSIASSDLLTREHRLYQTDWLLRKYGFEADEIPFDERGSLSLDADPKEMWARRHPERFPLDVNRADKAALLRVPGLGPTTVQRILERRRSGGKLRSLDDVGRPGKRLRKAAAYVKFGC